MRYGTTQKPEDNFIEPEVSTYVKEGYTRTIGLTAELRRPHNEDYICVEIKMWDYELLYEYCIYKHKQEDYVFDKRKLKKELVKGLKYPEWESMVFSAIPFIRKAVKKLNKGEENV